MWTDYWKTDFYTYPHDPYEPNNAMVNAREEEQSRSASLKKNFLFYPESKWFVSWKIEGLGGLSGVWGTR